MKAISLFARAMAVITALLLAMTLGAGSPADAKVAATKSGATVAAKALPKRNLNDTLVHKNNRLFMKGKVDPSYKHRLVVIQRRDCKSCDWHRVARVTTNSYSRFSYELGAPKKGSWFYRAFAKKYNGYGKSWSTYVYRTYQY